MCAKRLNAKRWLRETMDKHAQKKNNKNVLFAFGTQQRKVESTKYTHQRIDTNTHRILSHKIVRFLTATAINFLIMRLFYTKFFCFCFFPIFFSVSFFWCNLFKLFARNYPTNCLHWIFLLFLLVPLLLCVLCVSMSVCVVYLFGDNLLEWWVYVLGLFVFCFMFNEFPGQDVPSKYRKISESFTSKTNIKFTFGL